MMRSLSVTSVLTIVLFAGACSLVPGGSAVPAKRSQAPPTRKFAEEPKLIVSGSAQGVIVHARDAPTVLHQCSRPDPVGTFTLWTPTIEDVTLLESKLPTYVDGHLPVYADKLPRPLVTYKRQYIGLVQGQKKYVYANLFQWRTDDAWLKMGIVVCDGGASYFGVQFDLESERFVRIDYNGMM